MENSTPDQYSTQQSDHTSDSETTVAELRALVEEFVAERSWHRFHTPKNLVMSLAIETGELMEHFQWLTPEASAELKDDPQKKHDAGEEIADCLAYLLGLANAMELDLSQALFAKMIRNAKKYPVDEADQF